MKRERYGRCGNEILYMPPYPWMLYSAICPRCAVTVPGPSQGILLRDHESANRSVARILAYHQCAWPQ
jgi:hypothetical protein